MLRNLEKLSDIKKKLKEYINNYEIFDIILFGSTIKGKANPEDIDIAIITDKEVHINIKGFHIIKIKPEDFIKDPPSIATTLIREGFSLKNNKYLAEIMRFKPSILYTYKLTDKNPSDKVKIVRNLKGNNNEKGFIENEKGEWLANQVFLIPIESEHVISQFFIKNSINFTKKYILIH